MPDEQEAVFEMRQQHAMWPGGRAVLVVQEIERIGSQWWLVNEDGSPAMLLAPYVFRRRSRYQ